MVDCRFPDSLKRLHPHDLISRIDKHNVSCHSPSQLRAKKNRSIGYFGGMVLRRKGECSAKASSIFVRSFTARADAVFMGPAEIAFTRMFRWPSSLARYRILASRAAFATPMTL